MAHLSGPGLGRGGTDGASRSDRAQLILVGAFALAVIFVALALVMNAAIYTENLATRSESAATADAHAFHRATTTVSADAFQYAHEVNDSDHQGLKRNVTQALDAYYNVTRTQQAAGGQLAEASVGSTKRGTNITDETGSFVSPTGSENWTLASGVTRTRKFRMQLETLPTTEEFRVVAGGVSTWYLNISVNGSKHDIGVVESGTYTKCDTTALTPVSIDFSAGTVNGLDCPALNLHEVTGSYALNYENSSEVEGDYQVIVDVNASRTSPADPEYDDVLYSMEVDLVYWTPELRYDSTIRVAPGEYSD